MIVVDKLYATSGAFRLENASFTVPTGEYAVLMGRTGCGKTTLLEAICGLKPVEKGRILLRGRDVTSLKPADRGIGYVPQDLALFPTMSVFEQLAFSLSIRKWDRKDIEVRVKELAALLGISRLLARTTKGLSGGESQRVALGRALAYHPQFLLLDEPLSALDESTRDEMYELLRSVQKVTGVTTLHVTHSKSEARRLGDKLFVFEGRTIEEIPIDDNQPKASASENPPSI